MDWTADSNKALKLSLVRAPEDKAILSDEEAYEFHPSFTYPIFGEEEKIYGYRDLVIDLRFSSGSLAQYLSVSSSERLPSTTTVDDVEGTLYKFIPADYYRKEEEFLARVEKDALSFKPLGEKIHSYKRKNASGGKGKAKALVSSDDLDEESDGVVTFEVYHATFATPGFREYHRRMQLFILLYIEAGSYIEEDDENWEFVVLYEKRRRRDASRTPTYHFVGYSSLYPFYCFPERVRMRLSQFVILPPYQRSGHGSSLYNSIYQYILNEPRISELTLEDPAEAFEDLRDLCDLRMLLAHAEFMGEALGEPGAAHIIKGKGKLGPPTEKGWIEKWRRDLKIAGRQYQRLIEMLILKHVEPSDTKAMRAYRLQVKERLYKFNYQILTEMTREERLEKLEETFQNVKEGYQAILSAI
ncbi:histone acetyltransferase type B catalytic subunit [Phellopilus nigrolimitatus]|nr:histone acetyltransferase type B catalytic subunit [Phellopilus nigrolimitatus]